MRELEAAKRYRAVLNLSRSLLAAGDESSAVGVGRFYNGGFEKDIATTNASFFEWQIKSTPQVKIALDTRQLHGGRRSLRIVFDDPSSLGSNIAQLVVVEPSSQYRFECYVRAEKLKSAGAPTIEIADAADGSVLSASAPLSNGSYDWQAITIDFKTSNKTEAIIVRTSRASCGAGVQACPIFGTIWYDDFNLQSIGGGVNARNGSGSGETNGDAPSRR